jgi:tRNA threonylcarbamoyladenosine modification (KEOPS) complex Cgi121 subunit
MRLELLELILNNELTTIPNNLKLFQFKGVRNVKDLLKSIKSGDEASFPNSTVLDCSRIVSKLQIEAACTKAYLNYSLGCLKSKSIYTEILLSLSPNISIVDSFKNFGVRNGTKDIFIIIDVGEEGEAKLLANLREIIVGEYVEEPEFKNFNETAIKKVFAIDDGFPVSMYESAVLGAMAVQGL